MTDDLTTRLLAAIEQAEQNALLATQPGQWAAAAGWRPIDRAQVVGLDGKTQFDSVTTAILRHCAAHRKIVELHTLTWASGHPEYGYHYETTAESKRMVEVPNAEPDAPYYCATCADQGPCPTLLALAEGYDLTAEPAP